MMKSTVLMMFVAALILIAAMAVGGYRIDQISIVSGFALAGISIVIYKQPSN